MVIAMQSATHGNATTTIPIAHRRRHLHPNALQAALTFGLAMVFAVQRARHGNATTTVTIAHQRSVLSVALTTGLAMVFAMQRATHGNATTTTVIAFSMSQRLTRVWISRGSVPRQRKLSGRRLGRR